jgi:hypothetical protein
MMKICAWGLKMGCGCATLESIHRVLLPARLKSQELAENKDQAGKNFPFSNQLTGAIAKTG